MIEVACRYRKPVRIGVNWGSLDQELLAKMMDDNAQRAEPLDAKSVLREALGPLCDCKRSSVPKRWACAET